MKGMDFRGAINRIMPDVQGGSNEPFIIYRDGHGGWHGDHTQNQYGEQYDWVNGAKEQDPFAVEFKGEDFANGSFPYVYDTVLCNRLRVEYFAAKFSDEDDVRLPAFLSFFAENAGSFSHTVTDYLTTLERPLAALAEMCPFNMNTEHDGWSYDEGLAQDAISRIENAVSDRLHIHVDKPISERQAPGEYKELNRISINDSDIILSENLDAENRYMVVENRYTPYYNNSGDNNIFTGHTNDYLEAITEFTKKVQYNIDCVQSRRDSRKRSAGIEHIELKSGDCLPGSGEADFTGKLIIVKANELKPEYRSAENQLVLCSHGNGARPNAIGTSVFGEELFSGDKVCYGRHQIHGIADETKLPQWATIKLALLEEVKEPGENELFRYDEPLQKEKNRAEPKPSKPSMLGKLDENKRKVERDKAEKTGKPAPNKRGSYEHSD